MSDCSVFLNNVKDPTGSSEQSLITYYNKEIRYCFPLNVLHVEYKMRLIQNVHANTRHHVDIL